MLTTFSVSSSHAICDSSVSYLEGSSVNNLISSVTGHFAGDEKLSQRNIYIK